MKRTISIALALMLVTQLFPGAPARADSTAGPQVLTVLLVPDEPFVLRKPSVKKEQDKHGRRVVKDGDELRFVVKNDVWHDGELLIRSGTPAKVRVGFAKTRKVAGVRASMELSAVSTEDVHGRAIPLRGSARVEGKSRIALAVTLCLLVAWPLIFIHGGRARSDRVPVLLETTAAL